VGLVSSAILRIKSTHEAIKSSHVSKSLLPLHDLLKEVVQSRVRVRHDERLSRWVVVVPLAGRRRDRQTGRKREEKGGERGREIGVSKHGLLSLNQHTEKVKFDLYFDV